MFSCTASSNVSWAICLDPILLERSKLQTAPLSCQEESPQLALLRDLVRLRQDTDSDLLKAWSLKQKKKILQKGELLTCYKRIKEFGGACRGPGLGREGRCSWDADGRGPGARLSPVSRPCTPGGHQHPLLGYHSPPLGYHNLPPRATQARPGPALP